jgi:exodeoxyribonuclease VII large subunit
VFSPSSLIDEVNALLDQGFSGIQVEGEITNASASGRGHLYFSIKDERAQLDALMWASRAAALRFELEDGLAVRARGSLTIYRQRGRFQLVVEALEPQGIGALQLAFEQLKRKLDAEGLFAADRKRALPALPNRVGIVTSATGAALQDMLRVLRRVAHLEVVVAPAMVQGAGAAAEIAAALGRLGASGLVDVIIVGRGGGSLEDLWAFNEEDVARAIAASPVPVISGVGHEVDFTIADFVADIRATTPTQAAELVVSRLEEQQRRIADAHALLLRGFDRKLGLARTRLAGLIGSSGLARVPQRVRLLRERFQRAHRLGPALRRVHANAKTRLDHAVRGLERLPARVAAGGHRRLLTSRKEQLALLMATRLAGAHARIRAGERALTHLGPTKVLERGYSITSVEGSLTPLRDASAVRGGQALTTRLARGVIRSLVRNGPAGPKQPKSDPAQQPSLFDNDAESQPEKPGAEHE